MRRASKFALLAISVIAAMSMAAPSAFAQTVEVLDEDLAGQPHCGAVTAGANHAISGGCAVQGGSAAGTSANLFAHVAGVGEVQISACTTTSEAHINEDGLGFMTDQVLTGAQCGLAPCDEAAPSHANLEWPLAAYGSGGNEALASTFCIRPASAAEGASPSYCSLVFDATRTGHEQTFTSTENSCVESANELSGTWVTNTVEGEIEITDAH